MHACVTFCDGDTYVSYHAQADEYQNSLRIREHLPSGDKRLADPRMLAIPPQVTRLFDVLFLSVGDVQEPTVGGVEQRDTKGEPDAHDPEFGNFWH